MALVIFVNADGTRTEINIEDGISVMEGGVRGGVDGLDADCGGQGACATCHVHVDPEWASKLVPPSSDEMDMLEFAFEPDKNSRLSCQILCNAKLDGLIIRVPSEQSGL